MCNLYSVTTNQEAIIRVARVMSYRTGNTPLLPGIFPNYSAPIVRNSDAGRGAEAGLRSITLAWAEHRWAPRVTRHPSRDQHSGGSTGLIVEIK
ncbi:hypothetical protein [Starkeya sp. ORNL1]|uniref:hypothetical protein n=1 Tax=Starkeya sp. ORNL1 TaxID=2709380 RepID=UPI0019809D0D